MSRNPNFELAESIAKNKEKIFDLITDAYYDYAINKIEVKEHLGGVMSPEIISEEYAEDERFNIKLLAKIKKKSAVFDDFIEVVEHAPFNIFKMFYEEVGTVDLLIRDYPEVAKRLLPLVNVDYVEMDSSINSDCLEKGFLVEIKDFKPKSLFKKGSYNAIFSKKPALLELEKRVNERLAKTNLCFVCVPEVSVVFAEQYENVAENAASGHYVYTSVEEYCDHIKGQIDVCPFIKGNSKTTTNNACTYKKEEEAYQDENKWNNNQFEAIIFDKELLG